MSAKKEKNVKEKKKISLTSMIFIALIAGAITGMVLHYLVPDSSVKNDVIVEGVLYVLGQGFIRLMKMLVVPLVFCSLVCGSMAIGDTKKLGNVGGKTLAFYLVTTAVAVAVALGIGTLLRPGIGLDMSKIQVNASDIETMESTSLVQTILDMYPEKTEAGEPVNILQVQQGAGYNSPFDRRQVGYEPFETDGKIKTVERIAPIDDQNATSSMRDVTAATLQKYGEGDIDGIWCCYDAYAQGVYQALREADSDIPMVSVDICNEDIQFMQEGKNWKACATTNWTSNGEFACRVLALEMADQYEDIEAASCYYADPGAWMEIPSVIVTQEMVTSKDGINIENLAEVAGEDYSDTSWMPTCDWMVEALGH